MQRNSRPLIWKPQGATDTLDASTSFSGAMSLLTNLIQDQSTANLWQCRPASIKSADFIADGFDLPGFVSVINTIVGNFVFGMVATQRNPGRDEPFCFSLVSGNFVPVAGITPDNVPQSPLSGGAWVPPVMDLIGTKLIVCHPGFNGSNDNYFGWFDVSNPAAPVWHAGNLTGAVQFTTAPSSVAQFNQRAYYITNNPTQPAVVFSDVLAATNVTNANQVLTFGDTTKLTALGGLPLSNQLGGIIQALMVFKDSANIYQVTGDAALSTLASNSLNITTGTQAPRTVCPTPKGLAFISPQGLRVVDFQARVSDPIGNNGTGIVAPFIYSVTPSRMAAACGGDIYRVSTQNGNKPGAPQEEYWYSFSRGTWSGPHTFPFSGAAAIPNSFIITPINVLGSLWQSDSVLSLASTFVENGQQMTFDWRTSFLPDTEQMTENAVTEASINIAMLAGAPAFQVSALNQNGTVLDTVSVSPTGSLTLWGQFNWGQANWGGTLNFLAPRQLPWTKPIVFCRLQIDVTGQSSGLVKIGTLSLRYQILRYLANLLAAVA